MSIEEYINGIVISLTVNIIMLFIWIMYIFFTNQPVSQPSNYVILIIVLSFSVINWIIKIYKNSELSIGDLAALFLSLFLSLVMNFAIDYYAIFKAIPHVLP